MRIVDIPFYIDLFPVVSYLVGWPVAGRYERQQRALAEVWEQSWVPPRHRREEEQSYQRMREEGQGEVEEEEVAVDHH